MVICFFGDSLTQGIGDPLGQGWAGRLVQACLAVDARRAVDLTFYNLGLRGDSAPRLAARWRAEAACRVRPGEELALVLSFGTADGHQHLPREQSLAAARDIFAGAVALGRVLFIAPPPVADPAWSAHTAGLGREFRALAAEAGIQSFDLHAPLAGSAAFAASLQASDAIHPDAHGYAEMAALLRAWQPLADLLGL